MKKFDSVVTFSKANDEAKNLVTGMEDYARQYCTEKMGAKMSYDTKYTMTQKAEKINRVFASELQRRSGMSPENFDNITDYANFSVVSEYGVMLQKVLVDTVTPIVVSATGTEMLSEIHYGGYNDVFEYTLTDNSVYAVSKMGRRQKHTKTQERKTVNKTIATEMYGLTTYTTLPAILVGDAYVAEDAMRMAVAMVSKVYALTVDAFVTGANAITDTNLTLQNYDEDKFISKLKYASAKNGAPMVIVGDAVALKKVLPSETRARILLQDEYVTKGYITQFNGYTVIGLDAVDGADGIVALPEDRIYGIPMNGTKLVQVAIGATITNTDKEFDNNNLAILSTLRKELGVDLATNYKVVRVNLA